MGGYKEHKIFNSLRRRGIIIAYIILIIVILIVSIIFITKTAGQKEIQEIVYNEDSKIDYKVYLKENEFYSNNYLEKDNQYIASLIDYVSANFKYELDSPEKGIEYKYSYKVKAEVEVKDSKTQNSIYKFNEDLIKLQEFSSNTDTKLIISENIKIDYNKYNDIIKKFVEVYDLNDFDASLVVNMYVNLLQDSNETKSTPVMTLRIPLTEKTMPIDIESKTVNETTNTLNVQQTLDTRGYLFIAIMLIFFDLVVVSRLLRFIKDTKNEEAIYDRKLRKIMVSYGSYVQKLNNEFDFENYQVLEIELFEDLLQIRETVNKPILMIEKDSSMETYFFIPTEKNVYLYELKKGSLANNKGKGYKAKKEQEDDNKLKI